MTTSEIFEAARQAGLELLRIEQRTQEMIDRIGVQGQSYERVSISGVLDPMRKVDDLLDWEIRSKEEHAECSKDIAMAQELLAGIRVLGYEGHAKIIEEHFLNLHDWGAVANRYGLTAELCRACANKMFLMCDSIGIARMKEMGRG